MRDALREANEDELIEVFDALNVCATYTKPTRRLELAATVTPELVASHEGGIRTRDRRFQPLSVGRAPGSPWPETPDRARSL